MKLEKILVWGALGYGVYYFLKQKKAMTNSVATSATTAPAAAPTTALSAGIAAGSPSAVEKIRRRSQDPNWSWTNPWTATTRY